MLKANSFGVIGGDKRQIAMAEMISADGYNVYIAGFEKINFYNGIIKSNIDEVISKSDYIILPLPVTKDYITLNAPFSKSKIILNDEFAKMLEDKKVFCGVASKLMVTSDLFKEIKLYDYYQREDFMIKNAVPTAEGAIQIAMKEYEDTINGSNCLVAGFGRIGKVLSRMLYGLGANVTVSARKPGDIALIKVLGYKALKTCEIYKTSGYDLIFNTIPQLIFDAHTLAISAGDAVVIDLASLPGGVDFEAAKRLGIKAIQALSLPGKVAPKAAGKITKETIYNMIEEEEK